MLAPAVRADNNFFTKIFRGLNEIWQAFRPVNPAAGTGSRP
jgi:hypothetical protein